MNDTDQTTRHHLNGLLYGFCSSAEFARRCGATPKEVMAWRNHQRCIPAAQLPQVAAAMHQLVNEALFMPACIARLNKLMGYERRAA